MNKKTFFRKIFFFAILILAAIVLSTLLSVINNKIEKNSEQWQEIRYIDKNLIKEKIQQGKEYLLRIIDPEENGVHKYYYPANDTFENRLYTIYTSSTIYTFLKIYNLDPAPFIDCTSSESLSNDKRCGVEKDEKLLEQIYKSADFVLSMQNKKEKSRAYGAFYYSYYPENKEKEQQYVVGTSAKTIFTLLKLYELSGDKKYLESAKLTGDWLLTMQKTTGSMKSYIRYDSENKKWFSGTKESLIYNGQVLSALSRLYLTTKEERYYKGAKNIAKYLAGKYEEAGRNYISDDYRKKDPISNSWIVMSLIDFCRAGGGDDYKKIIFEMADRILDDQRNNSAELSTYGGWKGAYSTSGNAWLSEVFSELYHFCREENPAPEPRTRTSTVRDEQARYGAGKNNCENYKEAVVKATRWLIQYTYSEENVFNLGVKNPKMAIGGVPWDQNQEYIRTDSVCHSLNSYLNIIDELPNGSLISISDSKP